MKKYPRQKHHPLLTLSLILLMALLSYAASQLSEEQNSDKSLTATMTEAESNAMVEAMLIPHTNPTLPEQIVSYEGMTVSFNPRLHIPNWVSWELTADEVDGNEDRSNRFFQDLSVDGCPVPEDYRGSGYDRGHMAPAADMRWSPKAMSQSFFMTNICPQAHSLNGGAWKKLEEKCRLWAMADSSIVVIAGPVNTDPVDEYIGEGRVAVPRRFFKVVAAPLASPPRGIGFIMNNGKVEGGMQAAAVSIDSVEAVTGHDFFAELPDSIQHIIESQCRFNFWSNIKPRRP